MTARSRCRALPVFLLALVVGLAAGAPPAHAGKADDLVRALLSDPSYKVRVQAAILLGRLADQSALPPLVQALGDENRSVRAMAAQALGRLGDESAAASLKSLLRKERDSFVRSQAQRALAALEEGDSRGKKVFVTVGPFSGGTKAANPAVLAWLRESLKQSLSKLPQLGFGDGAGEGGAKGKGRRVAFLVDGNVSRLDEKTVGSGMETSCEVKVMVARWPGRSIILWTSASAAVQGGKRDRDKLNARRDCIEASAGQLGESLVGFFRSHGG